MECPVCHGENIDGVDVCEHCQADLRTTAAPVDSAVESALLTDELGRLSPARPITVSPATTVAEAVRVMVAGGVGCVLVTEGDRLRGIFTERDVLLKVAHRYDQCAARPVRDFMTPDPESLGPDAPIGFALNLMAIGGYRHVPIVHDGRATGIISVRDVLRYMSAWYPDILGAS